MTTKVECAPSLLRADPAYCTTHDEWEDDRNETATPAGVDHPLPMRNAPRGLARGNRSPVPPEVLRDALRYITDNLDSRLRWEDIAAAVGLGAFAFGRGFKLATGVTPHQYVIRYRIRRAMELLMRPEPGIADIALEVGCSCQSHLTTLFRKHTGTTPGAFRRAAARSRRALGLAAMTRPASGPLHQARSSASEPAQV